MDASFKRIGRGESIIWGELEKFAGSIALPINVGLKGVHWTLALLPSLTEQESNEILYIDPLGGLPGEHERKVIELVHYLFFLDIINLSSL